MWEIEMKQDTWDQNLSWQHFGNPYKAPCPMIAKLDAWSNARQPRADGYYWARSVFGHWLIAEWRYECWWKMDMAEGDDGLTDADFWDIDERRLLPPA
jgi:hypothetical protein